MKIFSLHESPYEPVSHDPQLKKRVITRGTLPCVQHVSHIIMRPGDRVSEHTHKNAFEVMYCIGGAAVFIVNGLKVSLNQGNLLSVEPGDSHSIAEIREETELLYFLVEA
ncbi:MAG: cupin domain-containing protein [Nitrospirota bacterium]